ncbi:dipeptide epimerase [Cohaesibacter gelatinilyticus]|uniref:Dipeptide epimerase n=1 Tax=Cohaesibacter gelatinilyticus TaxID=372072 RepID=A0A285PFP4_9HYPH|nr:dipeptide epimerase [Cohaesibacter gelatinilyticus]SNZ20540.1 L-alanine-DL-glutamate epimerase [Cohaesibacter gelatinilyticus]
MINYTFKMESWPLARPFRFAGFSISALDIAYVTLESDGIPGHGEGVVPVVFDISAEETAEILEQVRNQLMDGEAIDAICRSLPPGPARNALDCALWDLRAKTSGKTIWELAGLPPGPDTITVDQTIGLDAPKMMAQLAKDSTHDVLKIKADAEGVLDRVAAIRKARPDAELIIDANQSWSAEDLRQLGPQLADLGVAMIEQPLSRECDHELRNVDCPVPIYADESCHTREDLPDLIGLYQGINIKLDKTGGLTEALALAKAAKDADLGVMVGCMAGTSLSMAPAYVIGTLSNWSDLDGPLLLASDRPSAMTYKDGALSAFSPSLWG